MKIRINDTGEITSLYAWKKANQHIVLAANVTDQVLADVGLSRVVDAPYPTISVTQKVVPGPVEEIDGVWTQTWVVEDLPEDEAAAALQRQQEATIRTLQSVVQSYMDTKVQERNYDNIFTACTYATSTNPKFQAEGQACVEWRDAVWVLCYQILDDVLAGNRPAPTREELISELPTLTWPDEVEEGEE